MESLVLIEREGPVVTLSMNRPATRNALNPELLDALGQGLAHSARDPSVKVVVLTGAGGSFSSGADLKGAISEIENGVDMGERIERFHALIRIIVHAGKPFVAAVAGPAVGFGADLALACDLRVLSEDAYLQEKFVNIGLMPDGGGTFHLARLVGLGRALEYLLLGTRIDAAHALNLGLASRVVPAASLMSETLTLARELAALPPLALAAIKHAVRDQANGTIDAALAREKAGQIELLRSDDLREGVRAWLEGRTPTFHGR